jgi:hypothetical protein
MQMQEVKSSQIRAVGYDPNTSTMQVEFSNGARYTYHGVESHQHRALMHAESIGTYFHKHIRGRHRHEKIT